MFKTYNQILKGLFSFLFTFLIGVAAHASYYEKLPVTIHQPDGSSLKIFATGDGTFNYLHDEQGFTIIKNSTDNTYYYAGEVVNNQMIASSYKVGSIDPSTTGLTAGLLPSNEYIQSLYNSKKDHNSGTNAKTNVASNAFTASELNNIVVFIRFSDTPEFSTSMSSLQTTFNSTTQKSVRNYFSTVSNGEIDVKSHFYPQANIYPLSFVDNHPRSYYEKDTPDGYVTGSERTKREHALLKAACEAVADQIPSNINFDGNSDGKIDNVIFIIQGGVEGWSELLWPHRWSLFSHNVTLAGKRVYDYNFVFEESLGIGVLCHELFHTFGAPDLYRYTDKTITPVGGWDLMASGNWSTPVHMNTYYKKKFGDWGPEIPEITTPGDYTLLPQSSNPFAAYKIPIPNSTTEFLLVEYRKKEGLYESSLPGREGFLVTRINTLRNGNANGPDDEVYVFRPQGSNTNNGYLNNATLVGMTNSDDFFDWSNPKCFLSDGSGCDFERSFHGIHNLKVYEDSCVFTFGNIQDLQKPYNGTPLEIPGTVEAEEYDLGGADVAYRDFSPGNIGGSMRNDDVDLSTNPNNGNVYLSHIQSVEWLEYTVDVKVAGYYNITMSIANQQDLYYEPTPKTLFLQLDYKDITDGIIDIPVTSGPLDFKDWVIEGVHIENTGEQILRLFIGNAGTGFNIDNMVFEKASTKGCVFESTENHFSAHLTQENGQLSVLFDNAEGYGNGYTIMHYTINGGNPQNVYITPNQPYIFPNFSETDVLNFSFTYSLPTGGQISSTDYQGAFEFRKANCDGSGDPDPSCVITSDRDHYQGTISQVGTDVILDLDFAPGYGDGYIIIHYQLPNEAPQNLIIRPQNPLTFSGVDPNEVFEFSFTYTLPEGGQISSTDYQNKHHYLSGTCAENNNPQAIIIEKEVTALESTSETITVAPNPTTNNFTINSSEDIISIDIIGSTGNNILTKSSIGKSGTIDCSSWASGVYYLRIETNTKQYQKKIMVY